MMPSMVVFLSFVFDSPVVVVVVVSGSSTCDGAMPMISKERNTFFLWGKRKHFLDENFPH